MKFSLSLCVLVIGCCSGIAVPQSNPVKFVLLDQKEEDDKLVRTTEADDAEDEVATTAKPEPKLPWNPGNAWKELNFPIIPEGSANAGEISPSPPAELDFANSNVNISGGRFTGRVPCQCGRARGLLPGGSLPNINTIPWTAAITKKGFAGYEDIERPYCGGALINDRYVLTASHCVQGMLPGEIKVYLNDDDLLWTSETVTDHLAYDVARIIMHPQYDRRNLNFDIAVLKLAKRVEISVIKNPEYFIVAVCIPANDDHDLSGQETTAVQWRRHMSQEGNFTNVFMKVNPRVIQNHVCGNDTEYSGKITENFMCADFIGEGGNDFCQVDSGGPLTIDKNGRGTLVGVHSWGYGGCKQPSDPAVYTRVGKFSAWILDNTKDAEWCE